jgi:hypothetical protein
MKKKKKNVTVDIKENNQINTFYQLQLINILRIKDNSIYLIWSKGYKYIMRGICMYQTYS